jgi:hypothetical protein
LVGIIDREANPPASMQIKGRIDVSVQNRSRVAQENVRRRGNRKKRKKLDRGTP